MPPPHVLLVLSCATASAYVALRPVHRLGLHHAKPAVASQSLVRAPRLPRHAPPQLSFDLGASYLAALHEHYYATAALQAFPLVAVGDLIAQTIERKDADADSKPPLDLGRTLQMGMLGTLIGGFGTAAWLRQLEHLTVADLPQWIYEPALRALEAYAPEHGVGLDSMINFEFDSLDDLLVLAKAVLDSCIWAPVENTLFLVLTPLIEGASFDEVGSLLNDNFLPVMQTELGAFFPYNLLAFSLVPPLLRPFSTGLASMFFSVYISLTTHTERTAASARHLAAGAEAILESQPGGADSSVAPDV